MKGAFSEVCISERGFQRLHEQIPLRFFMNVLFGFNFIPDTYMVIKLSTNTLTITPHR